MDAELMDFDMDGLCRAIAESSPMPMVALEIGTHKVKYANPAFCALLGKGRNELVGHTFPGAAQGQDACLALLDRVSKTGKVEIHTGLEDSPAHPFYWSYAVWPIFAADGAIGGVMIQAIETSPFHRQVTAMNRELILSATVQHPLMDDADAFNRKLQAEVAERQRVYAALEESEERFRLLYNALPVGAFVCDREGLIQNYNLRAVELWGREPKLGIDRFSGALALFLMDGTKLANTDNPMNKVLRTGAPERNIEMLKERPDGSRLPVIVSYVALKNSDGAVSGVIITFDDISDRLRAEKEARDIGQKYNLLAESMSQKIFTTKANGELDYVNRQWFNYSGKVYEDFEGWGWKQLIHPEDIGFTMREWLLSIETGAPFEVVHRFRRWDGQFRWHLTRAQALRNGSGKISMWLGSNTDIQDQKELEAELRWANDDLRQFAFAASHDLLEPLRTLSNYSQLLVRGIPGPLSSEAETCINFITESAARMRTLLTDLLAYTEAGADRGAEAELIDLNRVFQSVKGDLALVISENEAVVTSGVLPTICGHEARLVQLFQNLIGNAIKYRGERAPVIHIEAARQGRDWLFTVTDNGLGIDAQHFEKIFGVFTRLHGKAIPGTGIGLAICQRIVERYGGKIWVESQVGQRTIFYFTLPIEEESIDG